RDRPPGPGGEPGGGRRHAGARVNRSRQPVRPGQVLWRRPRRWREADHRRRLLAAESRRSRQAGSHAAPLHLARGLPASVRPAVARLAAQSVPRARGGLPRLARRGDRGPDRPFWGGGGRRRSGAGCGQAEAAERLARGWAELFPGCYYIEVQRAGFAKGEALVARSVALAGRLALPVVAT